MCSAGYESIRMWHCGLRLAQPFVLGTSWELRCVLGISWTEEPRTELSSWFLPWIQRIVPATVKVALSVIRCDDEINKQIPQKQVANEGKQRTHKLSAQVRFASQSQMGFCPKPHWIRLRAKQNSWMFGVYPSCCHKGVWVRRGRADGFAMDWRCKDSFDCEER